ncbi:extracellular solute-binding protein [Lutibaculum baratangense]|uniref:Spermidine/putrescine ABC transporter, periplasmic spermidine/putrescine-binding protein n=1 Tax=Lutibaculum baratangense AMV1 TaxID=631454 RepID=V4RMU8_9HYPH|nr:extracellular solute-binding protein [Lutibaculum baratangense]ESR24540.1 spermidine/putrescine ABC transporter, periplasmic spermidine/putrescine-binding protein [Lutibaculum baratangense AMV1]
MKGLPLITALAMGTALVPVASHAADAELVVFDWAGYEDPAFHQAYIDKHGASPTFAFFGDEEEAFQKLRSGFRADAAHPCSQSVAKWNEAGLLQPIDTGRIEAWDDLIPAFRDMEGFTKNGDTYFVPFEWGNTALTYRTDSLNEDDVRSLQAFADPKFEGQVSIGDNVDDAYALAFLATGVHDWTEATDEDFERASDFLRKVHENVRAYWSDGANLAQLMQSGEVTLAWAWNETATTMQADGQPVAMKLDTEEGSSAWVCGYVHLADAPGSEERFYDFVNATLTPDVSEYLVTAWGYGHGNEKGMSALGEETLKESGFTDPAAMREETLWQAPIGHEMREKMIAEFERIKAGF